MHERETPPKTLDLPPHRGTVRTYIFILTYLPIYLRKYLLLLPATAVPILHLPALSDARTLYGTHIDTNQEIQKETPGGTSVSTAAVAYCCIYTTTCCSI